MAMNEAQARAYIAGEEYFDEYEWNREHANRLVRSVEKALKTVNPVCIENLIKTAKHYIRPDSPYMKCNPEAKTKLEKLISFMEEENHA